MSCSLRWICVLFYFFLCVLHRKPQALAFSLSSSRSSPRSIYIGKNLSPLVTHESGVLQKKNYVGRLFCERVHDVNDPEQYSGSLWNKKQRLVSLSKDYLQLMRPITLFQAVGAFTVGKLVLLMQFQELAGASRSTIYYVTALQNYLLASLSIYLSYGAGMAMNDIVDAKSIDVHHPTKQYRPIPSGKISTKEAWTFVSALSLASYTLSIILSTSKSPAPQFLHPFPIWTLSNLLVMFSYAKLGFQKVLFLKNLLVGYLSVSPLLGAAILMGGSMQQHNLAALCLDRLRYLTVVGLGLGTAREIIKDMEDMDVDSAAGKLTLPVVFGMRMSHAIAYSMVAGVCILISSPSFITLFAQRPYWGHVLRIVPGIILSIRAALSKDISHGQVLLKKSIYAFLIGSVIGLLHMMIMGFK